MKHIPFPSIEQFRSVVKHVNDKSNYDKVPRPTLKFRGTTKLHGTNAAYAINLTSGEVWHQSREQIITPEKDNAGFSRWVSQDRQCSVLANLARVAESSMQIPLPKEDLVCVIYGEWCGGSIQKGVALNQLEKMFVIFGVCFVNGHDAENSHWLKPDEIKTVYMIQKHTIQDTLITSGIFYIENFPCWYIDIDFTNPAAKQNELVALTEQVEALCPVGACFDVEGVGEGIVWECVTPGYERLLFKVKGEKHQTSKVKTLAAVDTEVLASVDAFVEATCTENRLEQGLGLVELDVKSMGPFLKWIGSDIIKEESDTLAASGLESKQVMGAINRKAKDWFLAKLNLTI